MDLMTNVSELFSLTVTKSCDFFLSGGRWTQKLEFFEGICTCFQLVARSRSRRNQVTRDDYGLMNFSNKLLAI